MSKKGEKVTRHFLRKYLLGESKHGVNSLAHLDEVVPETSKYRKDAEIISEWFREHGHKKTGVEREYREITKRMGRLQIQIEEEE